jgi:hypothetical protein
MTAEWEAELRTLRSNLTIELPRGIVEPADIALSPSIDLARLFVLRGLKGADVIVTVPTSVRPGQQLVVKFVVSSEYPFEELQAETVKASLNSLLQFSVLFVSADSGPGAPLAYAISPCNALLGVRASIGVPAHAVPGDAVYVTDLRVAGQVVSPSSAVVPVKRGMQAPLAFGDHINFNIATPAFVADGGLLVPQWSVAGKVLSFNVYGCPEPDITAVRGTSDSLFFDEASSTLIVGGGLSNSEGDFLCAVDLSEPGVERVRWMCTDGIDRCYGSVVVNTPGHAAVVVAGSRNKLHVHNLADGTRLTSFDLAGEPSHMALDALRNTIYVSVGSGIGVLTYTWDVSSNTLRNNAESSVVPGDTASTPLRPLAILHPAGSSESSASYLIVAECATPNVLVLEIPSHQLVHQHSFTGMSIRGIAAEPSGEALALCDDESGQVHLVTWPLPGMQH